MAPAVLGVTLCVQPVLSLPLHAPLAAHDVVLVVDQVSVLLLPNVMAVGFAPIVTDGSGDPVVTVSEALAGPTLGLKMLPGNAHDKE